MKNKNQLSKSLSPYLLQHSTNPVDWYPWGEKAFLKAKQENKPIFLSIGYSTCHWCHVMEHESFQDISVAKLMNEKFVNIKVDREEMPEIDHLYMSVCQAMTGRGGWPLTIIMSPDKNPFFAGTYFPRETVGKRPGMLQLLPSLENAWKNKKDDIENTIDKVKNYLVQINTGNGGEDWDETYIKNSFRSFASKFDPDYGGFGKAPKFPSAHNLIFLLRFSHFYKDPTSLKMVETSLQYMRRGGIYDHIGLGFHRYSTDKQWFLPHFEKMLYDQAMLAIAYLETFNKTKNPDYGNIALEIFEYIKREMTDKEGGFFSAEDADTEGEEGAYYTWTIDEIEQILGSENGKRFTKIYGFEKNGNFFDESTGHSNGKNIPYLSREIKVLSKKHKMEEELMRTFIKSSIDKLYKERSKRIRPLKDDKILTDWNGLMIASLAYGGLVLNDESLIKSAKKAYNFINEKLTDKKGKLLKRYRLGNSGLAPHIDDYAFLIWGCLNLYDATYEVEYLNQSVKLAKIMITDFSDENGGFFIGAKDSEKLMIRSKDSYDGAIPSGNSVAVNNLFRLSKMTGNQEYKKYAINTLKYFSNISKQSLTGFSHMTTGFMFDYKDPIELVIVGDGEKVDLRILSNKINEVYYPNKIILFKDASSDSHLEKIAPWVKDYKMIDNKTTYYLCKNFSCERPTTNIKTILNNLDKY